MKKTIYYFFALSIIFFSSCTKENNILNQHQNISLDTEFATNKTSLTINGVFNDDGVLNFVSKEAVYNAHVLLEETQARENEAFYATYIYYTQEEMENISDENSDKLNAFLDQKSVSEGFSENYLLKQFESKLNFKSLRSIMETKENDWLSTNGDNLELNPYKTEYIIDEFAQTFINEYHEIIMGNSIFILMEDGYLEITDGNRSTMLALRGNNANYKNYSNVRANYGDDESSTMSGKTEAANGTCKAFMHSIDYEWNGNSKRFKWALSRWTYPWGYKHVKSEIINQKKSGSIWKNYVASYYVAVDGTTVDNNSDCSGYVTLNNYRSGSAKSRWVSVAGVNKVNPRYSLGYSGIQGIFRGAGKSNQVAKFLH